MKCFFTDNAITIFPNGNILPCCRFVADEKEYSIENIDNINKLIEVKDSDTFTKVRNELENSVWPIGCKRCERDETLNIKSRRQIYNENHFKNGVRIADVAIGNFCNLKCIMCNSVYSTQWHTDQQMLLENNIGRTHYPDTNTFFSKTISDRSIDKIIQWVEKDNADIEIELKGGEPLALPNSKYLFEKLSSVKNNVKVILTTNGTFFPDWFPSVCEKIKINLSLSIDGLEEVYDYVRGSEKYSYKLFYSNLEKFKKLPLNNLNFNYVVQNTNVHCLKQCIDQFDNNFVNVIFLQNPNWLQVWNMPDIAKHKIKQDLESIPKDYYKYHKIYEVIENINKDCNEEEYKTFIKFSALLDNSRNKNLPSIAPHLFTEDSLLLYQQLRKEYEKN